jgi:hypothetical protein
MTSSGRNPAKQGAGASAVDRTGTVAAGRFVLEVGGAGGSIVSRIPEGHAAVSGELPRALRHDDRARQTRREKIAGRFEHEVERTSETTDAVERATELFKTLAEGRVDPKAVSDVIDELLSVTGHFIKSGRMAEAMQLGRALCGVLALVKRWVDLVRTLRELLSGAQAAGDAHTVGWACHELGTLHLCAENPDDAGRLLRQARSVREDLRDRPGIAATDHNLQALCRLLQDLVSEHRLVQPRQLVRRFLFLAVTLAILLGGGGTAVALLTAPGPPGHPTAVASTPSTTGSSSTTSTAATTSSSTSGSGTTSRATHISFTSGAPPSGTVRQAYGPFQFAASGDTGIVYSITSGHVPGLALSPDGQLSGTPTQPSTFPLTITAAGASGARAEQQATITINKVVPKPTLSFTSGAPPGGTVGQAYGPFQFAASGDNGIVYSITSGQVPGLALSPDGQLSGTPTQPSTFPLTITAVGASGARADQPTSITISPPSGG